MSLVDGGSAVLLVDAGALLFQFDHVDFPQFILSV